MSSLSDRFRHWFVYERDAHAKLFSSLDGVPEDGRSTPGYERAVTLAAHLVAARRIWLSRIGYGPTFTGPVFPAAAQLETVKDDWLAVEPLWTEYLESLDDAGLARIVDYRSTDGGRFRNSVEEILTQLFGHSWYHRGQIAMLVREAGGTPAMTDLIYWAREPVV